MKIIIINDLPRKVKHAGFKARQDVLDILIRAFPNARVENIDSGLSLRSRFFSSLRLLLKTFNFKTGSICLTNYPLAKPRWSFLSFGKKIKCFKIVAIVHDLESLRGGDNHDYVALNKCDYVISHNYRMTQHLREHGVVFPKIIELCVFDYLMKSSLEHRYTKNIEFNPAILFAGNLSNDKSGFIYKWQPSHKVDLYGINFESNNSKNITWKGAFDPNAPELDTSFNYLGLVWDGTSTDTCEGDCGTYLKINNPHKISFYLSQGLPVIVWKQSAMADFILENKVGYTINELQELNSILKSISETEYGVLVKNATEVGNKIRRGKFLLNALSKINE